MITRNTSRIIRPIPASQKAQPRRSLNSFMEHQRDSLGRFLPGPRKVRDRSEYNKRYWREVRSVGERLVRYKESKKASYAKHCEKDKARNKLWVAANRERKNEIGRKWQDANPEKRNRSAQALRRKDPDKYRLAVHRRRIRLLEAEGTHTLSQWKELVERTGNRCVACLREDVRLTIDHIVPLSKGGTDYIDNIQPLCLSCNCRKQAKTINYLIPV